jgi:hypothetical protein
MDEFGDRRLVGDIGRNANHPRMDLRQIAYSCVQSLGVASANYNRAALMQERTCDGLADPARATGYDSRFAAQTELHCPSRFLLR